MGASPVTLFAVAAVALAASIGAVLMFARRPRLAVISWVVALYFVPVWVGIQAGIFVNVLTAITVLGVIAFVGGRVRWSAVDTIVVCFLGTLAAAYVFGGSSWAHLQDVLTTWILPYVWGRVILGRATFSWVASCIAVAALGASALAVFEFVTDTNIFFSFPGASSSIWSNQQYRGGLPRAEGAFGHSIALGGTLAMSAAFALATRWRPWLRLIAIAVIALATMVTFSRIGLTGLVLSLTLSALLLGRFVATRLRLALLVTLAVAVAFALPILLDVFGEAGSEASGSAEYRADLLPLLGDTVPLGVSPSRETLPTGEDFFGGYRSIDSALILLALRFGYIPLVLVIAMLGVALWVVLQRRGSPASVAIIGQIPAFATVALITQYAAFIWFVAGVAVASYTLGTTGDDDPVPGSVRIGRWWQRNE